MTSAPRDTDFLDNPPLGPVIPLPDAADEPLPESFGPYTTERKLGRGGYGTVYLAKRSDGQPQGRVAIKVIHRGPNNTEEILRRFRNEQHILNAFRKHPNIVTLLEGGSTAAGQPYFVMEYIEGQPLDAYCDEHRLTVDARLQLFLAVCSTVQFAHKHLIIHRDLKPDNILVTQDDQGRPVVKLLDFGIAKFLNPELSAETIVDTAPGQGQVGMTPEYASPEQIRNEKTINVTSDVYSLGVVLYELLTGHLPYRFDESRHDPKKVEQIITAQEPERPSTKIGKTGKAKTKHPEEITPDYVCQRRGESPARLRRKLAGDLDNIVLRAMHKEPERRYQSVEEFAQDVRSYLSGDPVKARGTPFGYHAAKFVRKHVGKFSVAALVFLAISLLSALALVARGQAISEAGRANREAEEARQQRDRAGSLAYLACIGQANQALERGDGPRSRHFLSLCLPGTGLEQRRTFEWYYLWRLCHSELRTLEHRDRVKCVAFAPDGTTLASAGEDGTVRVWDPITGKATPLQARATVHGLAFDSKGETLAAALGDGSIQVWKRDRDSGKWQRKSDTSMGRAVGPTHLIVQGLGAHAVAPAGAPVGALAQHLAAVGVTRSDAFALWSVGVRAMALARDGTLASAGADGRITLWEQTMGQWKKLLVLEPKTHVYGVAFAPDSKTLAVGALDGTIRLWHKDKDEWKPLGPLKGHTKRVLSVVFSSSGDYLASASDDQTAKLWKREGADWKEQTTLRAHTNRVSSVAFAPDGKTVATASHDRTVKLWTVPAGQLLGSFVGHSDPVHSVVFSPDGLKLATGSDDRTVKVWNAVELRERTVLGQHAGPVQALAFTSDRNTVASASWKQQSADVELARWEEAEGRKSSSRLSHGAGGVVRCLAIAPDGRTVATGRNDPVVRLWNALTGKLLAELPGHPHEVTCLAFAPDGRRLAAGCRNGAVTIWDVDTLQKCASYHKHKGRVLGAAFSPDGNNLATGGLDNQVWLWDMTTQEARPFSGHTKPVWAVAFGREGKVLATGSDDRTVRLWNPATGEELGILPGHEDSVSSLAFSPDGKTLAAASRDVKLWDVGLHVERLVLQGHGDIVRHVAFAPDGRQLVGGCSSGTVVLWKAATDQELSTQSVKRTEAKR